MQELMINETNIKDKIHNIRNQQVMLDRDLAELYGVETKHINQAVKRNENSDPNSIDKSNRIEYYMSMSEYTTLECVLRSLKKLKGEQK
jgi:hypothetical protein